MTEEKQIDEKLVERYGCGAVCVMATKDSDESILEGYCQKIKNVVRENHINQIGVRRKWRICKIHKKDYLLNNSYEETIEKIKEASLLAVFAFDLTGIEDRLETEEFSSFLDDLKSILDNRYFIFQLPYCEGDKRDKYLGIFSKVFGDISLDLLPIESIKVS